ncbi:MAG: transposase family protein, partial [Candidatus Sericytochromatia bacterium]
GSTHDFSLLKLEFPPEQEWFRNFVVRLDLGFLGFEKVYACKEAFLPQKKKKDQDLTPEEKEANRKKAQERIWVEHGIGGMKRYRILVDRLRTKNFKFYDDCLEVCAGLWNLNLAL